MQASRIFFLLPVSSLLLESPEGKAQLGVSWQKRKDGLQSLSVIKYSTAGKIQAER